MKQLIQDIFEESIRVKRAALEKNSLLICLAAEAIIDCLGRGNKVLFFGNGGSAADSQHIAAEFIGRFQKERRALPAIALTTDTSIITAISNDYSFDVIFARQVEGLGREGDIAFGISTSGNSRNVILAVEAAKGKGMTTISLTGKDGGKLAALTDISIIVPSESTARVQESHICIAHSICDAVERHIDNGH